MNDLFGIDPCAPSNLRDLVDIMRLFGPSEGRFIADFPMEWRGELRQHMASISDVSQMAMVESWSRIHHAMLPVKARFRAGQSWAENAMTLRDEVKKLIGPAGRPSNLVEPLDKVLIDPTAFPDANDGLIPRTPEAYVQAARPLLLSSRKIVLIDPFFALKFQDKRGQWCWDRRRLVLVSLLRAAARGKQVECFEIFNTPNKMVGANLLYDDLISVAAEAGAAKMQLAIRSLDEKSLVGQHARYMLGLESGLHFDHGFDTVSDGSTNHVKWIGKSALEPLLEKFT